jgi:MFS superfamily sulfate permease-like transporter
MTHLLTFVFGVIVGIILAALFHMRSLRQLKGNPDAYIAEEHEF